MSKGNCKMSQLHLGRGGVTCVMQEISTLLNNAFSCTHHYCLCSCSFSSDVKGKIRIQVHICRTWRISSWHYYYRRQQMSRVSRLLLCLLLEASHLSWPTRGTMLQFHWTQFEVCFEKCHPPWEHGGVFLFNLCLSFPSVSALVYRCCAIDVSTPLSRGGLKIHSDNSWVNQLLGTLSKLTSLTRRGGHFF